MSKRFSRRARPWRWVGYVMAALVVLAVVVVVGSWVVVRMWGPLLARERLEPALTSALGRPVHVGYVSLEPWRGRFVVGDVTASALPGEPGPDYFTLGRIQIQVGVSSVWRRRLVLRSIWVDELDLKVGAREGPALRELPLLPEVVQLGPLEIELVTLELTRGRLYYENRAQALRVQAQGVTVTARPGGKAMSARIAADEVTFEASQFRERVQRLDADISLAPARLEARRLAGIWEKNRITIAGRLDGPFDEPSAELTARGDVDLAPVGARVSSPWPLAGTARVNARLEGPARAPRVTGTVAINELTAGPLKARAIAAQVALARGVLSITQLSARAFDGSVAGSIALELARMDDARVTVRLRDVSSAALERVAGRETGLTARLDAEVDARGDLRDVARLQARIRLAGREVRLPEPLTSLGSGTINVEGRAERGTVEVARAVATWPGLELEARGQATADGPNPLSVRVVAELARFKPLLGDVAVAGDAALDGQLTGRWRDPVLAGKLDVRAPIVRDLRADHVASAFTLTQSSLRLASASLRRGQAQVLASGSLAWPASTFGSLPPARAVSVDLVAHTEGARLEDAAPWLPANLRGSGPVRITSNVDGTLAAWRVTGQVESAGLSWPSAPAVRDVSLSFTATPEGFEARSLRARVLDAALTARGRWFWAGTGELEADAGAIDLAQVPGLPAGLRLEGRAHAKLTGVMRDDKVVGSARVSGERIVLAGYPLGRGVVDLSMDGSAVRAEAAFPEARVAATAQGRLDGAAAVIATRLTVRDLEIEPVLKRFQPDLVGTVAGRLSVVATLDVPAREPRATRGVIRLEPVSFEAAGERWEARGPILVRREAGRLVLERFEIAGKLGTASGTGRVEDSGAIDATLRGHVPLALLAALRPEVREGAGQLEVDVRVGGTTEKPVLLGRGTITGGLLALHNLPGVIRNVEASLTLAPGRVRVEQLRGSVGAGTVNASGEIGLDGRALGAYQLTVTGRGLALSPVEGLETVWNADLTLQGRGARGVVRGEAHLARGAYTHDLSLLSMLMKRGPRGQPADAGRDIVVQIQVYLDDNLVVRTRQAQLRAGGSLLLQGTVAQPVILGTVETQEGRFTFRQNRFTLENAVVRFDNPGRLNPLLDVRATTRIRTYDVTMWLSGRPDDLTMRLASEPPLPQDDLLALVTLGGTRAEVGGSGGLAFAGEAAQLLSRELFGTTVDSPVDILEFGKSESGENEFRVGKRLDDRTTVIYSGSFAEGGKQKVRIEYQVIGPLLLAGEQVFAEGFGGDVILRLRFR